MNGFGIKWTRYRWATTLGALPLILATCDEGPSGPLTTLRDVDLVGAGDIADCGTASYGTADLLDGISGIVITLGDNAYPDGTMENFLECYHPSWGRHRARTFPTPGNHDYHVPGAPGYFTYFGANAGSLGGYYSFDLDEWHIVAYNSVIDISEGSPQLEWLRADLQASPTKCILAYGYLPRFSSGWHGDEPKMGPMWSIFYEFGVDVVLSGHDHHYERFAPLDPDRTIDRDNGVRQFIVGTGGRRLRPIETVTSGSEFRLTDDLGNRGVIAIDLQPDGFSWEFITIERGDVKDSGFERCR
jgi:acid phosphatase type 7